MKNIKVIKFSATWCGPCRVIAPIFDKISNMDEFKDIEFSKIDIDDEDSSDLVEEYSIRNVPTIVIVNKDNNEVIRKIIGAVQESVITSTLKEIVNG